MKHKDILLEPDSVPVTFSGDMDSAFLLKHAMSTPELYKHLIQDIPQDWQHKRPVILAESYDVDFPIYHLLTGLDKEEIVGLSKKIRIFGTTIQKAKRCKAVPSYQSMEGWKKL